MNSFAYPFGYHDPRVRAAVRDAGYRSACACGDLMGSPLSDPFALPRFIIKTGATVETLAEILNRPPSAAALRVTKAKEVVWRTMRRLGRGDGGRRMAASAASHEPLPGRPLESIDNRE